MVRVKGYWLGLLYTIRVTSMPESSPNASTYQKLTYLFTYLSPMLEIVVKNIK